MRNKKQINLEIGERIKQAREKKHFTQEKLAEEIDVSTQYISDLERGVVGASLSTLKAICIALNVTSDSLLFGRSEQPACTLSVPALSSKHLEILKEITRLYIRALQE